MSETPERLAVMANQIARNLAHEDDPAAAAAEHIRQFWTQGMIAALVALDADALDPVANAAVAQLRHQD